MRKLLSLLAVLLLFVAIASAQSRSITGRVVDENGKPVAFATVQVKGDLTATSADADGRFKINAQTNDVLVISAVNFVTKEISVPTGESIAVSLVSIAKTETEVVVTAQGIRRRPRELGYSIAKVSNQELTNGRSPQLAQGLSGKVSGLIIINANNSVDPAVKFTLRGYRSMSGNNDALVVIDGLPQPQGASTMFNLINPNDIENISILKGGQAATLYGSQAVNGAIIITMKKGQKGKLKVAYSSSYNVEKINILAEFQDKYGSGSHYAASFGAAGYKPNYLDRMADNWRSYENQQYGDAFDGSQRPLGRTLVDGSVNMQPYAAIKDIRKDIWNVGYSLNNQVSFSGGSDNSTFFFSAENNKTEGIVPEDKATRTGARFSASQEYGRLRIGFSAAYVQAKYDRTTFNFYDESINQAAHIPLPQLRDWRNNKFASPNGYYNDYYSNPYFRIDNYRTKYQDANISGNVELTYKIFPWLTATNKLNAMNNARTQKSTVGQFFHSVWAKSQATVPAPFGKPGDGSGITRALTDIQGSVSDNSNTENLINNEFQLLINKNFGDFTTKSILGVSTYVRKTKALNVNSSSIVVPDIYNVSNRRGELGGSEGNTEERKYGYYADVLIGWEDKVFLHGSVRFDASSRFYKPTRSSSQYSYIYPGVDISGVLTEIVPSIKSRMFNYAKLRVGYNKNGNDNIGLYGLDPAFGNAGGFPFGNTVGISVGDILPEGGLKPEFVRSLEVGGEFQLFNNRVNFDFAYYTQKSEGQVLRVTIPASTGFTNLVLNVGDTKNWGYETDIKVQILRNSKLTWDFTARGSLNENKVVKLYPGVSEFFVSGYTYAGTYVIQDQPFPVLKSVGYIRDPATNRRVVSPTTGYPLNTGPLKNFGRVTPKYMLGSGTTLSYSGFTLTTNWEYRGGSVMYSDLGRQMTFTGSGKWTEERTPHIFPFSAHDDGTGKYIPNVSVMTREAEYGLWVDVYRTITENFTVPAWFIKMRDINLSYQFPPQLVDKARIFSGATIALYGRNLVTVKDKANQFADPEFSFTTGNGVGINNTDQTPPVRQFGVNLNLTFK